ncbi:MAG: histidine phosphatase family protein [Bdellovibrionales bacterium]|nr:histidine phosphatase family protein [Bdellovibrionales bacterium]
MRDPQPATQLGREPDPDERTLSLPSGPTFEMPERLVFVRHGRGQNNDIQEAVRNGNLASFPKEYVDTPDREFRLSGIAMRECKETGEWLASQYPEGFDVLYVADHIRARETAARVAMAAGWHNVKIRVDAMLNETSWGAHAQISDEDRAALLAQRERDPLNTHMPKGEALLNVRLRSKDLFDRAWREFGGQKVLVFTHGEYMKMAWAEIEHMTTERQKEFFSTDEGHLKNCQVVEFASTGPAGEPSNGQLNWVRSSCPQAGVEGIWRPLKRVEYTPEQMLEEIERLYPSLSFPDLEGLSPSE